LPDHDPDVGDREDARALRALRDERLREHGFTVERRSGSTVLVGEHAVRAAKAISAAAIRPTAPDGDGRPSAS
jgi:hypothetical protein